MKQTLVIGSTVVDVLLHVPRLPVRGEDINIGSSSCRFGGCAYNVYKTLRRFDSPALLCSPVGTGVYGRMVRKHFAEAGIEPFISLEEENGCCYCLIEKDGERSFLSHHGAEYRFDRSWMERVDFSVVDSIFICGIEVEDTDGQEIVDFVCEHPEADLYFAPGPRIAHIAKDRMEKLLDRRPFLHLNETEALDYTGAAAVPAAAEFLTNRSGNALVISLGERGCYYSGAAGSPDAGYAPGYPAGLVRDTVGAGDAHCGAVIAALKTGKSLKEACEIANRTGAAVVSGRFS
ncbi:MAG: PfkB family carbohydrate kinase [Treponema sp.]|nr:PfkB family carbohydrate kinase [Treponema sp.]